MAKPKLTNADFCRASKKLRCDVAAIKTVAGIESAGNGFYPDGFPVLLFERHLFRKFTQGRYNATYPEISGDAGGYGAAGANQRRKFSLAYSLNPTAAIKATSFGKFQILGMNHAVCGYATPEAFYQAMQESEGKHLDAFVGFVIGNGLADELRAHNWAGFAKGYNGKGFRRNNYDGKMAALYAKFAKENIDCSSLGSSTTTAVQTADNDTPLDNTAVDSLTPTIQNADTIVNTGDTGSVSPAPTDVTLNAPQGMGSVSTATKVTVAGITVPPFLVAIIDVLKGWIHDGVIDAKELGDNVIGLIRDNTKYILIGVGLVVLVIIVKKITRELIFLVTVISHMFPTLNNVSVIAPEKVEVTKKWWQVWK